MFPAIASATDEAKKVFAERGVDVNPFTIHLEDESTFLFPITDKASQIDSLITPALEKVYSGKADTKVIVEANERINALFG